MSITINCGPMDHADFDEEKFKEAMDKVHELRNSDKAHKNTEHYYWMGYNKYPFPINATADQEAEYNQGANDRKRERES